MKLRPEEEYTTYEVSAEDANHIDENGDILNYDALDDTEVMPAHQSSSVISLGSPA